MGKKKMIKTMRRFEAGNEKSKGFERLEFELPNGLKGGFEVTEDGDLIESWIDLSQFEDELYLVLDRIDDQKKTALRGVFVGRNGVTW